MGYSRGPRRYENKRPEPYGEFLEKRICPGCGETIRKRYDSVFVRSLTLEDYDADPFDVQEHPEKYENLGSLHRYTGKIRWADGGNVFCSTVCSTRYALAVYRDHGFRYKKVKQTK